MQNINLVQICGNVGIDPEVKEFNGRSKVRLRVATTEKWEGGSRTEWHTLIGWGYTADDMKQVSKGDQVIAFGRLSHREYEKDGHKTTISEVIVDKFARVSKKERVEAETTVNNEDTNDIPF